VTPPGSVAKVILFLGPLGTDATAVRIVRRRQTESLHLKTTSLPTAPIAEKSTGARHCASPPLRESVRLLLVELLTAPAKTSLSLGRQGKRSIQPTPSRVLPPWRMI
jgi:hypothetical protein